MVVMIWTVNLWVGYDVNPSHLKLDHQVERLGRATILRKSGQ